MTSDGDVGMSKDHSSKDLGGAVVGDCFGKTHFICRVPGYNPKESLPVPTRKVERVAIVWDVSASMSKTKGLVQKRCDHLRDLALHCNQVMTENGRVKERGTPLTFDLFTFGIEVENKGIFDDVEDLIKAINDIDYDGGTDVTLLSEIVSDLATRPNKENEEAIDSVLVFSDGMDNLGRVPDFSASKNPYSIVFPVH
eukprot:5360224-Ditylum_brightwellii.AAC.1